MTNNADPVVRFTDLTKDFGRFRAVDRVTMTIGSGEIYGLLGPNGAGKSTMIRMLLGLIRPTSGAAILWGSDVRTSPAQLARVGSLVDGGTLYPFLTARQNLDLLGRMTGRRDPARAEALLTQVGLAEAAGKRVKGYSTGMKQRLGVAAALLGDPEFVVLDEPTNGLDINGIGEMRVLIRKLAHEQGRTVLLCSHLLNEVEQVCDRVAILHKGRVVQEAAMADMVHQQDELRIEATPLDRAQAVLGERWPVRKADDAIVLSAKPADAPAVAELLVAAQVRIFHLSVVRRSLEDAFLSITQGVEA